jgi:hypothetical protein
MTTLRSLLSPGYEPGDGTMDGAQLVGGHWWHPLLGSDSLQYVVDNARQAVEALRHQWPEPFDRPPTEADGDELGHVLFPGLQTWVVGNWSYVAEQQHCWLHTPNWRPKPEPSPKQRALALLKIAASDDFVAGGFSPDGIELLRQVVESAPDTTP